MTHFPLGLLEGSQMLVIAVFFCILIVVAFLGEKQKKLRLSLSNETVRSSRMEVGGWLILFCIALTLNGPYALIRDAPDFLKTISPIANDNQLFAFVLGLSFLLDYLTGAFGFYAGLCILIRLNGALNIAKAYLWLYLFSLAIYPLMIWLILDQEIGDLLLAEAVSDRARGLTFFIFWYLYLIRSKRVKATYK